MSKNASHVFVHNYIDSIPNLNYFTIAIFIALAVVIILMLLIIIVIVMLMMLKKNKNEPPAQNYPQFPSNYDIPQHESYSRSRTTLPRESSVNLAADLEADLDDDTDINSNVQNIPMSVLKIRRNEQHEMSSESSAGLCELLLTNPREREEVLYEKPPKLLAFAGEVYASTRRKIPSNLVDPGAQPSSSRRQSLYPERHNSLEWDYFEPRPYGTTNASNSNASDNVEKNTISVCWV